MTTKKSNKTTTKKVEDLSYDDFKDAECNATLSTVKAFETKIFKHQQTVVDFFAKTMKNRYREILLDAISPVRLETPEGYNGTKRTVVAYLTKLSWNNKGNGGVAKVHLRFAIHNDNRKSATRESSGGCLDKYVSIMLNSSPCSVYEVVENLIEQMGTEAMHLYYELDK